MLQIAVGPIMKKYGNLTHRDDLKISVLKGSCHDGRGKKDDGIS
jgi:hypothetical protein